MKQDKDQQEEQDGQEQQDQITEFGTTKPVSDIGVINIVGQVEGHTLLGQMAKATKYEHVIPLITQFEERRDIRGLIVILNTVGGDVEAGLAIAELIRSMSKPSVSLVLGGGHSIGVPLAVCTDYSFIVPTATMTVHPLRTTGLFIAAPQSFEYFLKMQERVLRFIETNSNISKERLEALMNNKNQMVDDIGTVLIGREAVDVGLIDEVGGLKEAFQKIRELQKTRQKKQRS